jgi:hypothetical protein
VWFTPPFWEQSLQKGQLMEKVGDNDSEPPTRPETSSYIENISGLFYNQNLHFCTKPPRL